MRQGDIWRAFIRIQHQMKRQKKLPEFVMRLLGLLSGSPKGTVILVT